MKEYTLEIQATGPKPEAVYFAGDGLRITMSGEDWIILGTPAHIVVTIQAQ